MNHENHYHYMKFFLNNELNALYVSIVFRYLAFSMVGIFVPIYLFFELSYSLKYIALFFMVYSFIFLIVTLTTYKLIDLLSFKYIILISSPLYMTYFVLLDFLEFNKVLFFIAPLVLGLADGIYWPSYHYEFCEISNSQKRGKQIGYIYNLSLLAGLVGPLMGGAILLLSGFPLLFILVLILLIGSAIPMFFTTHKNKRAVIKFKDIFTRKRIGDMITFFGRGGVFAAEGILWPIFIFILLNGYLKTGSLFTGISLITILFIFLISKLTDSYDKKKIIRFGTFFYVAAWIINLYVKNVLQLVMSFAFRNFASTTADLPLTALTYDRAKKKADYFVLREASLCIGRIVFLSLLLLFGTLESGFVLAAIFSLSPLFL